MLLEFPVSGTPDLGSAIGVAERQAMAAGYTHVTVNSTKQTAWHSWVITLFVSDSNGSSQRPTPQLVEAVRGLHQHSRFACPCGR